MPHSRATQCRGHETSHLGLDREAQRSLRVVAGGSSELEDFVRHIFWTHEREQKRLSCNGVDGLRGRALDGAAQQVCFTVGRAFLGTGPP